ncbi:MAG: aggregation factor core [Hyphomicrobiales bacterium]
MMQYTRVLFLALGIQCLYTLPAAADVTVQFDEGAPKDYFTFQNIGKCALRTVTLSLDLSKSKSGLIFDVSSAGAGVEVFQPLEFVSGEETLSKIPRVRDGDNQIKFNIRKLDVDEVIKFSIDVDDTIGGREITVSGSEIVGAEVKLKQLDEVFSSVFGANSRALISAKQC